MPLIIHLEGMDRCGKSTVSDMFATELYLRYGEQCLRIHSKYPPKGLVNSLSWEELEKYRNESLDNQFYHLLSYNGVIVMDRSWVGENVYGVKYRNRSKLYEYKTESVGSNCYILFKDDPENILKRDDGFSTFKSTDDIKDELALFNSALSRTRNVAIADTNGSKPEIFHKNVCNAMLMYYKAYIDVGYVNNLTFKRITEENNLSLGGIYDKC